MADTDLPQSPTAATPLWGAQTEMARKHFAIGTQRVPPEWLHALALIKGAAARVNARLGTDSKTGNICIDFNLGGTGPQAFGKITRRNKVANNVSRQLAILG